MDLCVPPVAIAAPGGGRAALGLTSMLLEEILPGYNTLEEEQVLWGYPRIVFLLLQWLYLHSSRSNSWHDRCLAAIVRLTQHCVSDECL